MNLVLRLQLHTRIHINKARNTLTDVLASNFPPIIRTKAIRQSVGTAPGSAIEQSVEVNKAITMVEKIADLNLPNSVVTRLIKDALPDGVNVGKEARIAIAKAASIFSEFGGAKLCANLADGIPLTQLFVFICVRAVIYLTSSTASAARKQKHKSLSSDNVLSALEEIEFENFIEPMRVALEAFRKNTAEKKLSKANETSETNGTKTDADDSVREQSAVMEIEE